MELTTDGTHARITIDTTLDAAAVEALIHRLAHIRARMTPGVPTSRPARDSDTQILEQDNTAARFDTTLDGGLRIWLRNLGLGWLAFRLPPRGVEALRQLISQQIADPDRPQ